MSVLAHVVLRSLAPEPAATQALGYILAKEDALRAFVRLLPSVGGSFEPRRVESEATIGDGRPDLAIYDSADAPRVLVENKFWAGLTDLQPTAYLEGLPRDGPGSALVFIVPAGRVSNIWVELKRRCVDEEVQVGEEVAVGSMISARLSENRSMVVASWQTMLDGLDAVACVQSDVRQLRALTDQMDAEAFLPIRPDELTDVDLVRRLINYTDLVEPIVEDLKRRGVADTTGVKTSHNYHATGRYLYMCERLGLWLGVDLDLWRDAGTTPMWWVMDSSEWSGVEGVWADLDGLFDDIVSDGSRKCVPVPLKSGVEREDVIADAADQMVAIAERIVARLQD